MSGRRWQRGFEALVALIAVCLACNWIETRERSYPSYDDAVSAGEMVRGWLPEWVPASSFDLRLRNDTDTNELWIEFSFVESDLKEASQTMRPLDSGDPKRLRVRRAGEISWWPEDLRGVFEWRELTGQYQFFQVDRKQGMGEQEGSRSRESGYLAVSWGTGEAYYWETSRFHR